MSNKQQKQFNLFKRHCAALGYKPHLLRISFAPLTGWDMRTIEWRMWRMFEASVLHIVQLLPSLHLLCEYEYITEQELESVL